MDERRKYPRLSSNFSLKVQPSPHGQGSGENVSQHGMFFYHDGPIAIGSLLDLSVRLAGMSGSIEVKGKVVRCEAPTSGQRHGIAVAFVDVDPETDKNLTEMLNSL